MEIQVGALAYNPWNAWLLSASKNRLYVTDLKPMDTREDFIQLVQSLQSMKVNKNRVLISYPLHLIL